MLGQSEILKYLTKPSPVVKEIITPSDLDKVEYIIVPAPSASELGIN